MHRPALVILLLALLSPLVCAPARGHEGHQSVESKETDSESSGSEQTESGDQSPWLLTIGYCTLIVAASLLGGWLPSLIRLTHTRMQFMMSLVGGLMLGIGLFHMLPHAYFELGSIDRTVRWAMGGLLLMFFLIRTFHFHQHDIPDAHAEHHHHEHHHHGETGHSAHRLSWAGIAFGLSLHTLIDGIALGASIQADSAHASGFWFFGAGTFLAILLHKPLDAVSITSLMAAGNWSPASRNLVNAGFAMMCPLGALLFFAGVQRFAEHQHVIVGCALAVAAGVFLCISLADLLPEMEFHDHNRLPLSAALLTGVFLSWAIGFLEPEHRHPDTSGQTAPHDHQHGQ